VQVKVFEAHSDYIRCIAVHGSQPLLLSSSDDMTIRLWDWEKQVCPTPHRLAPRRAPAAAPGLTRRGDPLTCTSPRVPRSGRTR